MPDRKSQGGVGPPGSGRRRTNGSTRDRAPSRLERCFLDGSPALICYFPLGDPHAPGTPAELAALYADAGVDVLEVGVPGGMPALDGPVITETLRRAARAGVTRTRAAEMIAAIREAHPTLGLVWYSQPPKSTATLVGPVVASGADALLLPASARSSTRLARSLEEHGVDLIHFLEHDPSIRDIDVAVRDARGYVMLQANPGPTGAKPRSLPDSRSVIRSLRGLGLTTPVALGIGISSAQQAREAVAMGADGVVVGSSMVEAMLKGRDELRAFLRELRRALDGG